MLERTAEMLTDGIRALILEENGYSTKLFEFVPTEHTPKNNMIAAVKTTSERSRETSLDELIETYNIEEQRLLKLLREHKNAYADG